MYAGKSEKGKIALISSILLLTMIIASFTGVIGSSEAAPVRSVGSAKSFGDLDFSGLENLGYRPRFAYPGAQKIQTPEPIPEGAEYPPAPPTSTQSSPPTRATWELYFEDSILEVYVDTTSTSRYPNGDLSTNEEQLLDRYISDFLNFSYPMVKDYYDPLDRVSSATFYVWDIDGPSGIGGYYQPGTDEFNVDRSDLSWGGVILAHEFQHYIHDQYDRYEYLWINEGCADYSAYLVYDITSATAGHVYAYLEYRPYYGLIVSNQAWQQDGTTAYYGNAFLYQLYMTHQYGGKNFSRALIRQTQRGTNGVSRALSNLGYSDDFQDSFGKWIAATRLNSGSVGSGEYAYPTQTYAYGQLKIGLTKSHSGIPVTASRDLRGYSITSLRFSSPPSGIETFRMKLTFSAGTPMVGFYPETSANKNVTFLNFGGSKSVTYDFSGWGSKYNAFQLILSSTSIATIDYDLDILDLDPPVTTMLVTPRNPDGINDWYISPPKVTLQTESGSDIKFQIDDGIVSDYVDSIWIPDGLHTLSYWAVDRHGNIEETNLASFKVDTDVPTSQISLEPDLPEDSWYTDPPLITLTSSHPETFLYYKFGNDDFQLYEGAFFPPEGESILYWRGIDQAGNQEDVRSRSFKVDTVPPHLSYTIYPPEPNGKDEWYISRPQVTLTSADAAAIYYAFGTDVLSPYLGPLEVPEGENTLRITCTDTAGNDMDEVRLRFKVDTIEPSLSGFFDGYDYTPENSSQWLNIPPILNLEGSEQGMEINYSINEGEPIEYELPFEIAEGENEIWVRGEDEAGNIAEALFFLVKVDKRVPFIEHSFSHEMKNGWFLNDRSSIILDPKEEDDRSSIVKTYYRWGTEPAALYKGPVEIPEGLHSFTYWAEDLAGNEMEPRTIQIKKDSTLPLIYLDTNGLGDEGIFVGDTFHVDLTGSSDDSGIQSYSIDYYGSGTFDWTPNGVFEHYYAQPGEYEVTVYVQDAAGNVVDQSFTVKVKEVETGPVDVSSDDSLDTGLLMIVIGIGAGAILLIIVLGIVLLIVRSKQAVQQYPPMYPGEDKLKGKAPHKDLPGKNDHRPIPPKPPLKPLPP
jgi:hypothetical protein